MAAEESTRAKMLELRMLCEKSIRASRERSGVLASSILASIKSMKPLVENRLANQGEVAKLKDHLKELEARFYGSLKVSSSKGAKHTTTSETISAITIRIEHLKRTFDDQREKEKEYEAVLSQQLLALQRIEEKNEDVLETKRVQDATDWYKSILGFQTEGGEGVKFTFNRIDRNDQDKEFWFIVRLEGDIYRLLDCNPQLDNVEELVEELNRTNGLFKFVRVMREKFKETCKDTYSHVVLSRPLISATNCTEKFNEDDQSWQSKKRSRKSLHQGGPAKVAILSPQSIPIYRRSSRLMDLKHGNDRFVH